MNFLKVNVRLAQEGQLPEKRVKKRGVQKRVASIEENKSRNRHSVKAVNVVMTPTMGEDEQLSDFDQYQDQRVLTEYELLGALVSNGD